MRLTRDMDDLKEVEEVSGSSSGGAAGNSSNGAYGAGSSNGGGSSPRGLVPGASSQYSIPGILHFLQHEWSRFEMDRAQWEVEKAELNARIAFLQGERKGQENLKNDLVRRIKMLEYALRQERAKYHKLKFGTADGSASDKPQAEEDGLDLPLLEGDNLVAVTNANWRQGKQLLRQYLQEIGYTDTIIDVRSNRVRSLLGLGEGADVNEDNRPVNGVSDVSSRGTRAAGAVAGSASGTATTRRAAPTTLADEMQIDNEDAVMANFDFLATEAEVDDDDDDSFDGKSGGKHEVDKDTEDVMNEFNFLSTSGDAVDSSMKHAGGFSEAADFAALETNGIFPSDWDIQPDEYERLKELYKSSKIKKGPKMPDYMGRFPTNSAGSRQSIGTTTSVGVSSSPGASVKGSAANAQKEKNDTNHSLELGELEQLTITNENEASYDQITAPKEAFRKTWSAKYTLRSHFDGVRALGFHPVEPVLITASEDQTLKLWNLQKTIPAKKSASLDVEPVYTFRAHAGPVLSLAVSPAADLLFSGGVDATVRCWHMPSPTVDPYDTFDPTVLCATLTGHTDAVWGLAFHGPRQQLLSCSADGTVKLWSAALAKETPHQQSPLLKTFGSGENGIPTSIDWVYENPSHMVTAYTNAMCVIYDVESGKPVMKLETNKDSGSVGSILKVVSHPTLPLTITAHEDRHIRFFDNTSGKMTHEMVAHLDAVTSLAIDTNGLYLISGSHDCSIRLWNLETKTCVQEITAHRKKFDESIFDVAFHPSKPFIASAGADALAKVFV